MDPEGHPPAFVDTSFVVRYLTGDPEAMSQAAAEIIDSDAALVLSLLVLVETCYVLESVYRAPRDEVVNAVVGLVQRRNVVVLGLPKPSVLTALTLCQGSGRVSYVDAVTWAQALQAGATHVYTFDRRFPAEGLTAGPRPGRATH